MSAFTTEVRAGIAIITFDLPNEPVNKITRDTGWQLEELLDRLLHDEAVRAIVIRAGKPDGFIAGADIEEFVRLRTPDEATRLSRDGQLLMQKVADAAKPIVAAMHGAALGGGLELALACRYRVASDHPKTQLGLPEVQLGLVPAAGGSVRLPRLIGARAAFEMILTGKSERAAKALRIGLVDAVVPEAILLDTAIAAAERLARGEKRPKRRRSLVDFLLDGTPLGRMLVYRRARASVEEKTVEHYPAPLRAIEVVRTGLEDGIGKGLAAEADAFGELAMTDVSRRLIEIFFATTALKKDDGVPPGTATPTPVRRIGVVGSGFMGSGIAGTAALNAGVQVRLRDAELPRVGKGVQAAIRILADRVTRRRLTAFEFARQQALISGTGDWSGFAGADIVIEAVFEDLAVKRKVMDEIARNVSPDAVIASNTSTLSIGEIAQTVPHPGRVLGMHFFSPVEKMPLLEVIPHEGSDARSVVTAVSGSTGSCCRTSMKRACCSKPVCRSKPSTA